MRKILLAFLLASCLNGCLGCHNQPTKGNIVPALDESAFFETPTPVPLSIA